MPSSGVFPTMHYFPVLNEDWNHKITFGCAFEFLYLKKGIHIQKYLIFKFFKSYILGIYT